MVRPSLIDLSRIHLIPSCKRSAVPEAITAKTEEIPIGSAIIVEDKIDPNPPATCLKKFSTVFLIVRLGDNLSLLARE